MLDTPLNTTGDDDRVTEKGYPKSEAETDKEMFEVNVEATDEGLTETKKIMQTFSYMLH